MFIIMIFSNYTLVFIDYINQFYAPINIFIEIQFFWLHYKQQKVKNNNIFPKKKFFYTLSRHFS